ncbi:MAG: L-lactate dehydrogenase [Candidatus Latescibacteria bacterium]|nr:L-lactate dehydrogenase [Candidatus Latescibacterota bacterium]
MNSFHFIARKVVVVGTGAVGATFAYALAQEGTADEIALVDLNSELVKGQVLDLAHGLPFFPPVHIHAGDVSDYADAHVIVITAGAKQRPGESRLELLKRNAGLIEHITDDITRQNSSAVIVVVSNPVDVLTYVAHKHSGLPHGRVIGSGTVLDSSRLRYLLSNHCGVDVHNVHAYILGEHGDSEFAVWSMTNLAGIPIEDRCPACRKCGDWKVNRHAIEQEVRNSAYHIIDYKGATHFAVGLALVRIVGAVLRNEKSVLSVSTALNGEYGLSDVCLGVPCIVAQSGVEQILEAKLTDTEKQALARSAKIIRDAIESLEK